MNNEYNNIEFNIFGWFKEEKTNYYFYVNPKVKFSKFNQSDKITHFIDEKGFLDEIYYLNKDKLEEFGFKSKTNKNNILKLLKLNKFAVDRKNFLNFTKEVEDILITEKNLFVLNQKSNKIGKSRKNDVRLKINSISKNHAEIFYSNDLNKYFVKYKKSLKIEIWVQKTALLSTEIY